METLKTWAAAMGGALLGILLVMGVAMSQPTENHLPPCATEDSDNCYWDADTQGNHRGQDSVVLTPQPLPEELP